MNMKLHKKTILVLFSILIIFSSCEDWLDVKPKTSVESSDLFQEESGYKDALWGVYTLMVDPALYGFNMTAAIDAMPRIYYKIGTVGAPYQLFNYNYTDSEAETLINNIWAGCYKAIANINSLISNLETADQAMFSADNYNVIYGEALGLRAYLHFDLLRLFAPSYASDPNATAIPYVSEFNYSITPQSTVSEVIEFLIDDLENAAEMLKESDPLYTNREITASDDNGYLLNRHFHMNYYAVKATLARAYLWKGDKVKAAACANEVINSSKYNWTSVDNIATTESQRDHTFTPEQVFALYIKDMSENIQHGLSYDDRWSTSYGMIVRNVTIDRVYPYASDWRGVATSYAWSPTLPGGASEWYGERIPSKLWQYEDMPEEYERRMPLIRLPEMYLIAAECNLSQGPSIINTIREHRGISEEFSSASTDEQILTEIRQEYLREFYCEGIVWYYYKRIDASRFDGVSNDFDKAKYVFPIPAEEIEFGNRN